VRYDLQALTNDILGTDKQPRKRQQTKKSGESDKSGKKGKKSKNFHKDIMSLTNIDLTTQKRQVVPR
jgi:hypothetical protein